MLAFVYVYKIIENEDMVVQNLFPQTMNLKGILKSVKYCYHLEGSIVTTYLRCKIMGCETTSTKAFRGTVTHVKLIYIDLPAEANVRVGGSL